MSQEYASIELAHRRLRQFEQDVSEESWKKDHDSAMQCISLESTLKVGIGLHDFIIALDGVIRPEIFKKRASGGGDIKHAAAMLESLLDMMKWWLRPCERVENDIQEFEALGFRVSGSRRFRKRHADAEWIVADAADLFDNDKFHTIRDEAVALLRASDD